VVLIMFPAVFDTTLVVISRVRAGRSIMVGGTDHTSHRLHRVGMPIRWVAVTLGFFATTCATLGVLVGRGVVHPAIALIPLVAVAAAALVPLLRMPVYAAGAGRLTPSTGTRP
jgi:UDP-GlcNAc:undecaprenyl-phosphate GlcNAc-1-phosphate transferase